MEKTNVMRILDQKKIDYEALEYPCDDFVDGIEVARLINKEADYVFKTLVCISGNKKYYVFVIPVNSNLDLKKCAKAVKEKNMELINMKDLLNLTGYIRGGCSPIGMKKPFVTVFNETALIIDEIIFSAGKVGYQVLLNPNKLSEVIENVIFEDIVI